MRVVYKKGELVTISFPAGELPQALKVLKALARAFKAGFLFKVCEDLERDLTPKLTYTRYTHLCEACCTEIDIRTDSYLHQNDRFTHYTCPVLKERTR